MQTRSAILSLTIAAATSSACSSSPPPNYAADLTAYCQRYEQCGPKLSDGTAVTEAGCESSNAGWHVPAGCVGAMKTASCADINHQTSLLVAGSAALVATCSSPCSFTGLGDACHGDGVEICDGVNGRGETYDCASVCAAKSMTYSGVCGRTNNGLTSPGGFDDCWCK
ncbi:MAG: hypothetical protein ACHREM_05450 [Polyangiales bacterium]